MDRPNFPDGMDLYPEDLALLVDTLEAEVNDRMLHITSTKGVAAGLVLTTQNDQVTIGVGYAYDDLRYRLKVATPIVVGVALTDVNKWIVIYRTTADTTPEAHPLTGVVAYRRTIEGVEATITATPTAAQVKLCKITAALLGAPPTISTAGADRDILTLKLGRPYILVAGDGSGDYTTLSAAIAALGVSGGKIHVKAGVYEMAATPVVDKSNVLIEGDGPSTVLRTADSTIGALKVSGSGVGSEVSNVTLSDMTLEYASTIGASIGWLEPLLVVNHAKNVTVDRIVFSSQMLGANNSFYGCRADENVDGLTLTGCTDVKAFYAFWATVSSQAGNATYAENNFAAFEKYGINQSSSTTGNRPTFVSNRMTGSTSPMPIAGISLDGTIAHADIVGNQISGVSYGVSLTGTVSRSTISGNTLTNCGKYGVGIRAAGVNKILVSGNVLSENGGGPVQDLGTGNLIGDNVS